MAVEQSIGTSIASPSANRVKSTGNRAGSTPVRESGKGMSCHQCRQTRDSAAACNNQTKKKPCPLKFCDKCLLNRYGEKVDEVAIFEEWICPKCRGICNCSVCMKRRGHQPTGILINTAKATGFSSVSEMLLESGDRLKRDNVGNMDTCVKNDPDRREVDQEGFKDIDRNKKSKKRKHCRLDETSNTIDKEDMLPLGTDLTSVAGIYVPAEDVGNALEFLEFSRVFGKILEMKNGEAECVLEELFHGQTAKRGKLCPVVQFHIHLLSMIKIGQGEKFEKLSPSYGKNSWFDALKKCLTESQCGINALEVDFLKRAFDYEALNASEQLRVLNLLCIEILGMKKLRNWIEDQNTKHEQKVKEARQKVLDAKVKIKTLKQKIKDGLANAVDARDGEQEAIVSHTKSEAEQARTKLLDSKSMLLSIDQTAHAVRIDPVFIESNGHIYWKLNCAGESDVLHQHVGKGDTLLLNEKWFALKAEEKEVFEKNICTRRK